MIKVMGVDYSGAHSDRNTWVCRGVIGNRVLVLGHSERITRRDLTAELLGIKEPVIVALDFPFGVPKEFAQFWCPDARQMPDLWAAAHGIGLDDFLARRAAFVEQPGRNYPKSTGPKREGDVKHTGCFSPLHMVNPIMTHMTFYGMQMLHQLWQGANTNPTPISVPPLPGRGTVQDSRTFLEVMPGAVLRALQLPDKGYKRGAPWHELRCRILDELPSRVPFAVRGVDSLRELCLVKANDDCLDAVVATVAAGLWYWDTQNFDVPEASDQVAQLEGWLYAPKATQRPHAS